MVSPEKMRKRFTLLKEYLQIVDELAQTPADEFLENKILIGSAKYYLQVSIECCIDMANHVIASENFRIPSDYADSFRVLRENGLISQELASRLVQMAKFRNRLVHLYGEVDSRFVYDAIVDDKMDIVRFKDEMVARFLAKP